MNSIPKILHFLRNDRGLSLFELAETINKDEVDLLQERILFLESEIENLRAIIKNGGCL